MRAIARPIGVSKLEKKKTKAEIYRGKKLKLLCEKPGERSKDEGLVGS